MDGLLLFNPFCGNGLGELDMLDPAMSPVIDLTKIAIPIIPLPAAPLTGSDLIIPSMISSGRATVWAS
jgi:hypothetical protein